MTAVAKSRADLVPACLWLILRRPASRLAVGAYTPESGKLAELARLVDKEGEGRFMSEHFTMTEAEAKAALASLAVELDKLRGKLVRMRDGLDRGWPDEMYNDDVPPSLSYWLFGVAETLLDDHVVPGMDLARRSADITEESAQSSWKARNRERNRKENG